MAFEHIKEGERPWTALGDFLNYWFAYASERREDLVRDPIQEPTQVTLDLHRWAVFCAATVEYLCQQYHIPCPDWVDNPIYVLAEPWFEGLGASKPQVQARLKQETPEPFRRRNIYCGPREFTHKYELAKHYRALSHTPPSAPSPLS
jgi:hypothetical protein